jgi:S1-C subfamily serine protease
MKKFWIALIASAIFVGTAYAQQDYTPARIAEMVKDSVVSIDASSVTYGAIYGQGGQEFARQSRVLTNRTTGFVYTSNGYIITSARGVSKDALIMLTTARGEELEARVVDIDEDYGIAVLKVKPTKTLMPVQMIATLYNEDKGVFPYTQGEQVTAIGYSGGFGGTVTAGIISGIRNLRNSSKLLIPNMIQTDAVINPGNEGSALFNSEGKVIGMHDRQAGGGSLQRTTFFQPMWVIKRAADEMIANFEKATPDKDFHPWRPWLGIRPFAGSRSLLSGDIRQVGDDLKMYMDWPEQYWDVGIWIDTVWQDGPAAEFGIKSKDVLYSVTVTRGDRVIVPYQYLKTIEQLETLITTSQKGDIFEFGVYHNGRLRDLPVEVRQRPDSFLFISAAQSGTLEDSSEYI